MINTNTALHLILENTCIGEIKNISIQEANRYVLAEDIVSPIDLPPYHQSAMDGYAFRYDTVNFNEEVPVVNMVPAGSVERMLVQPSTLDRVFTGSPIPEGADTVVIQEWIYQVKDKATFTNTDIKKGDNIRVAGCQASKGKVAVQKMIQLQPGLIGHIASLGIKRVSIFSNPTIGIITTGNEIISPDEELQHAQVYESNMTMLKASVSECGITPVFTRHSKDDETELSSVLQEALLHCQIVIMTGGISVGNFDFTKKAMDNNKVKEIFYKVKQKPGKPFCFGTLGNQLVFALPGNPASSLTCFYQYIVPCLRKIRGLHPQPPNELQLILDDDFTKKNGLTYFLKGKINGSKVIILEAQESFRLEAYHQSDCLICLEEERIVYKKGDVVTVYDLNRLWV